jgi:3-phosphoshikimate 1-carboxyvinyltransferase
MIGCQNSGTTLRLLMGIVAGVLGVYSLDGDESLRRRPMERVAEPLRLMGAKVETTAGKPPVRITGGGLKGITYTPPVASAQLKSAVMLAAVQAEGVTMVTEPAVSRDHTERLLAQCQADISRQDGAWRIKPSRLILPDSLSVPGDISSAAFFLCAAAILPGSEVTAKDVLLNPTRTQFLEVLKRMGAQVEVDLQSKRPEPRGDVRVRHNLGLKACEIMAQEIPLLVDEVPILALVASQARGTTVFRQVGELRVKESDRLAAIVSQLGSMGARARIDGDDLAVTGPTALAAPQELESFGDHRMAMMLRLAGIIAGGQPQINGEGCVSVSYPGFHHTLKRLAQ